MAHTLAQAMMRNFLLRRCCTTDIFDLSIFGRDDGDDRLTVAYGRQTHGLGVTQVE